MKKWHSLSAAPRPGGRGGGASGAPLGTPTAPQRGPKGLATLLIASLAVALIAAGCGGGGRAGEVKVPAVQGDGGWYWNTGGPPAVGKVSLAITSSVDLTVTRVDLRSGVPLAKVSLRRLPHYVPPPPKPGAPAPVAAPGAPPPPPPPTEGVRARVEFLDPGELCRQIREIRNKLDERKSRSFVEVVLFSNRPEAKCADVTVTLGPLDESTCR